MNVGEGLFSDIASSDDPGGRFENFAQQFLEAIGYEIVEPATRGADGGYDIIVREQFTTKFDTKIDYKWLVSCKFRSSGSVGMKDELAVIERLQRFSCNGFIGLYSVDASTDLKSYLNSLRTTTVAQIHMFDRVIINGDEIRGKISSDPTRFLPLLQTFAPSEHKRHATGTINDDKFDLGGAKK